MDSDVALMAAWWFSSNMTSVHKTSMEAKYSSGTAPSCVFLNAAGTQHQHFMVLPWEEEHLGLVPSFKFASPQRVAVLLLWAKERWKKILGCSDVFTHLINDLGFLSSSWRERTFSFPLYSVNWCHFCPFPGEMLPLSLNSSFWHLQESRALLVLPLRQVSQSQSLAGGRGSAF